MKRDSGQDQARGYVEAREEVGVVGR